MLNKLSIKVLILIITATMLFGILAGCGQGTAGNTTAATTAATGTKAESTSTANTSAPVAENALPIVKEPLTLTYWKAFNSSAAKVIQNLGENAAYQEMEKRTGIHIEFLHPPVGQEQEQYKLLIATNDLPDMIEHHWYAVYPGGPDKGIDDGVFLKLNDLIDKYAPNYKKLRESNEVIKRLTITDAGNMWSIPEIQEEDELPWNGPVIRVDWLEELGLQMPTTISEWYNVLTAFKKKGVQSPLVIPTYGYDEHYAFIGAYQAAAGRNAVPFIKKDNVVKFGPLEPGFKDYLAEMRKWYSEGLIDQDFMTRDSKTTNSLVLTDKVGAWTGSYGSWLQSIVNSKKDDPKFKIAPAPYPSLNGEKVHLRNRSWNNKGYDTVVTTACKNPVEAVKWLDYHFSEEGELLFNYGIEGKSYTMVNGKPQFTEEITNNPDGLSYDVVNWKYKLHVGTYLRDWRAYPFTELQYDAMDVWNKADYEYNMPLVSLTPEESSKVSTAMSEIHTYISQMVLKFIIGSESMDNFDDFTAQIKKMGIEDIVKIYQAALDRYNSR